MFWEMIVLVIVIKKVRIDMCLIQNWIPRWSCLILQMQKHCDW